MAVKMGNVNNLEVIRETDLAYIVSDGIEEVFLHKKQATKELEVEEKVDVFVYFDNARRKTATMSIPTINTQTPTFCKVVDVKPRLGAFLDVNLPKDLLLSRDDLPFIKDQWPKAGDYLFVRMKASRNQLTAKIVPRYETMRFLTPENMLEIGDRIDSYVQYFSEEGMVLLSQEGHNIYVYQKHYRQKYRLGQHVNVKISNIRPDDTYNGTLIEQKEIMMSEDAEIILAYLVKHKGEMLITDKSDPMLIMDTFNMSKSAFKRAIGTLYKSRTISMENGKISLNTIEKE